MYLISCQLNAYLFDFSLLRCNFLKPVPPSLPPSLPFINLSIYFLSQTSLLPQNRWGYVLCWLFTMFNTYQLDVDGSTRSEISPYYSKPSSPFTKQNLGGISQCNRSMFHCSQFVAFGQCSSFFCFHHLFLLRYLWRNVHGFHLTCKDALTCTDGSMNTNAVLRAVYIWSVVVINIIVHYALFTCICTWMSTIWMFRVP